MKSMILIGALLAALAGTASAHPDHHAPAHGGVFVAGRQADFELVATPTALHLHVTDHGKPFDVSKGSAKLTLLSGGRKQEVTLQPVDGRLAATGTFDVAPGTQVVAVVTHAGKTLGTAKFTLK